MQPPLTSKLPPDRVMASWSRAALFLVLFVVLGSAAPSAFAQVGVDDCSPLLRDQVLRHKFSVVRKEILDWLNRPAPHRLTQLWDAPPGTISRLQYLQQRSHQDSPFFQLLYEADPNFLTTGLISDPITLDRALERLYQANGIPLKRWIFPGRVFQDRNGQPHFIRYSSTEVPLSDWIELEGKLPTELYFQALQHGINPISISIQYVQPHDLPMYVHEIAHLASFTVKKYNDWLFRILDAPVPIQQSHHLYQFLESAYEFDAETSGSFLKTLEELSPNFKDDKEFVMSLSLTKLQKLTRVMREAYQTQVISYGGASLDQFSGLEEFTHFRKIGELIDLENNLGKPDLTKDHLLFDRFELESLLNEFLLDLIQPPSLRHLEAVLTK